MNEIITIQDAQESALLQQGSALATEAATYAIVRDDQHRDTALAFGQRVKRMRVMVGELFDEPIQHAHKLHKSLCGRKNALDDPLKSAEETTKRGIGAYEAAKRTEIERARQAEIAEARRKADEAEASRQFQIAEARRVAEEQRIADALALDAVGRKAEADALLAKPVVIVPPPRVEPPPMPVTPAYEPPDRASTRTNWLFTITDETSIPREFLKADQVKIGAHVRTHKAATNIPGVQPYPDNKASFR